jgi:hypothetical protein
VQLGSGIWNPCVRRQVSVVAAGPVEEGQWERLAIERLLGALG